MLEPDGRLVPLDGTQFALSVHLLRAWGGNVLISAASQSWGFKVSQDQQRQHAGPGGSLWSGETANVHRRPVTYSCKE